MWSFIRLSKPHTAPRVAQETPAFCRNTLCAPAVVEYLRENYLVWGGDIRHQDAFQLSGALRATTYPFLAVLANHNSRVTLLTYVEGDVNPGELLTTLSNVLDQQGAMLVAARAEVEERVRAVLPPCLYSARRFTSVHCDTRTTHARRGLPEVFTTGVCCSPPPGGVQG